MPTIHLDNHAVDVPAGATVLQAARGGGIDIPTLCYRENLPRATSCMLCVVEDCADGRLLPACSTPAEEGMRIATASESVCEARRTALDLLLSDHAGDCDGPCQRACPAGMDIPALCRAIARNDMAEAIRIVKRDIPLPAVLGRICPAPCEKACRRGFRDGPVGICRLKRAAADADLAAAAPYAPKPAPETGFRVAVVGAGPTGLSAAYYVRCRGHRCTLFEKEKDLGGALRSVELRDRLPAEVLDAEIEQIVRLGVEVEAGVAVGQHIPFARLRDEFDAVILALGDGFPSAADSLRLNVGTHGIRIDKRSHATGDPRVFAGGNAVGPSRLAVRAVAHGHAVATSVDQALRHRPVVGRPSAYCHRLSGTPTEAELDDLMGGANPEARVEPTAGNTGPYTATEARREAARCMHCDCRKTDSCLLRQYATEHEADPRRCRPGERRRVRIVRGASVVYEPGKCIACGICIRLTEKAAVSLGLTFVGRGFDVRVAVPFHGSLQEGLGVVAKECVESCPTGALAWLDDIA